MKDAVMATHDAMISTQVKQTRLANQRHKPAPFAEGDFVYLSTKNLSFPKDQSRKLAPKYVGPFKIIKDFGNSSYKLELPSELKRKGIHPSFHASLLQIHQPNNDRRFPGCTIHQVSALGDDPAEWAVEKILSSLRKGEDLKFEVLWKSGDQSWAPLSEIKHLNALKAYLEAFSIDHTSKLPEKFVDIRDLQISVHMATINMQGSETLPLMDSSTFSLTQLNTFAAYAEGILNRQITADSDEPPLLGYTIWAYEQRAARVRHPPPLPLKGKLPGQMLHGHGWPLKKETTCWCTLPTCMSWVKRQ
jgi:hypothetical protein